MKTPPLLSATSIGKVYSVSRGFLRGRQDLHALSDISLTVGRGEIVGLVGESGCGKSTLARILLGLEAPTTGTVAVDGVSINESSQRVRARRIQPVFQDPYGSLNPSQSIADSIELPLAVHQIGGPEDRRKRVRALVDMVGLPKRMMEAYPNELSGGQRQRVAIARALAIEPELLICDEPTSALDVSVQAQILNLLLDLRDETKVAMLFISHDLAVIEHLTDRMIVMYLGRVVETGPTAGIFAGPLHPYTRTLREAVFTPDDEGGLPDLGLKGTFPNPLEPPTGCAFHPRCPRATPLCAGERPVSQDGGEGRTVACHHAFGGRAEA